MSEAQYEQLYADYVEDHFRAEADRIEAEQADTAYLDDLVAAHENATLRIGEDLPSRMGMRAVLAKLEADGRLIDPDKLTRVAVIDHREETPLQYDRRTQGVMVSVQDRGRTLKLFTGRGAITPEPNLNGPWSDWREVPEGIPFSNPDRLGMRPYRHVNGVIEILEASGAWGQSLMDSDDMDHLPGPFHRVPRVWNEGDHEPGSPVKFRDRNGVYYECDGAGSYGANGEAWGDIAFPVTEVLPEDRVPRVWNAGDPEPEGVDKVRDAEGETWTFRPEYGSWAAEPYQSAMWGGLTKDGPLTEILPEETNR